LVLKLFGGSLPLEHKDGDRESVAVSVFTRREL
jgi:hypothetical protein